MPTQLTRTVKETQSLPEIKETQHDESIHSLPTQLRTESGNNDSTTIIDETINESVDREDPSQSPLQVNQLLRRANRSICDDSEGSSKESQSEEVVRSKVRKRKAKIIESDSETDAEDEMIKETVANLSNSETDAENEKKLASDSETDAEDLIGEESKTVDAEICKVQVAAEYKASTPEKSLATIDSDSDIDDFQFNTQAVTSNFNEDEDDLVIPSTQLEEEPMAVTAENPVEDREDVSKMVNSVEMDSLYLEATQASSNDEALLPPPASDTQKLATSSKIAGDDDEIFIKPTQVLEATGAKDGDAICNGSNNDDFIKPTQILEQVNAKDRDDIFEQATQPVALHQQNSEDIYLQATQPIRESEDQVFLKPAIPSSKKNLAVNSSQSDDIFMQPTQPIVDAPSDDIFLQPTQSIGVKVPGSEDQVFEQPTQIIIETKSHPHDDVFDQPTQPTIASNLKHLDIEKQLEYMFASQMPPEKVQQVESQLEVVFDSQKVVVGVDNSRPSNPLLSELEDKPQDQVKSTKKNETSASKVLCSNSAPEVKSKDPIALLDRLSMTVHEQAETSRTRASSKKSPVLEKETDEAKLKTRPDKEGATRQGGPKRSTRGKSSAKVDTKQKLQLSIPHVTSDSPLEVEQASSADSSIEAQLKHVTSTSSLKVEQPQSKKASGIGEQSKVSPVVSKRSTRGKGNAKVDESKPSKAIVTSTPIKKSTRKKAQPEKYAPIIAESEPEILSTRSAGRASKSNDVSVEGTKRPKRNTSMPKKFADSEVSVTSKNPKRSTETPLDSESEDSSKSSKVTKRRKDESDHTTSASESEQQTRKVTQRKRVLNSVKETAVVAEKKRKPSDSESDEFIPKAPGRSKVLNSSLSESTPERNKRALKPKVVFTMLDSPELETVIRRLGGRIVDTVEACTVLVTGSLKRSQKLLMAVGQCKPICSPDWIRECKKVNKFIDPWDYILRDEEAEDKWQLSLKESLKRSRDHKLLEDYVVYLTVSNAIDVLKSAIEACGGKCVQKAPAKSTENLIVVANPGNKAKYSKFLKQTPPPTVVLPEAIFDGVLRQELHLEDHLLK